MVRLIGAGPIKNAILIGQSEFEGLLMTFVWSEETI